MRHVTARSLWTVVLTVAIVSALSARQQPPSPDTLMGQALHEEEAEGNLDAAIATYKKVVADATASRALAASALLHIGLSQEKLGRREARAAYERIAREYADQAQVVAQARTRLAALAASSAVPEGGVTARQVWAGEDVDSSGMPSADGRLFAYLDWSAKGTANVAVRDLVTGETRYVTHAIKAAEGSGSSPVLSPDSKQVAYAWEAGDGTLSIRITAVDGSASRVLLQKQGFATYYLRWSPNGRHIAALLIDYGRDRTSQIVVIRVADGRVTQLKSLGWDGAELGGFSPDGRLILYSTGFSPSSTNRGIYALAVDGSREAPLVLGKTKNTSPVWTPDGQRVVFLSDRSGTQDLWSVRVADGKAEGEPELLRASMGDITNMGFTRDGSYFYGIGNQKRDVYVSELDPHRLQMLGPPTRVSDRLIGANAGGAWSPDGRFLAFFRGTDRQAMSLVVRTINGGAERTLQTALSDSGIAGLYGFVWMPDSRALLLPEIDHGHNLAKIRKVDIESGSDQVLVEGSDLWPVARVSPDGRTLYFTRVEKGEKRDAQILHLIARDLAGGTETELYRTASDGVGFFALTVSPDGSRIAFMANEGKEDGKERTLMTVPAAGGPRRVLYRGPYNNPTPMGADWTRDGRYVLAFGAAQPRGARLLAFPAEGGDPRPLDLTMQDLRAIGVSPDGRRVLFTGIEERGEVWTIRNLLPPAAAPLTRTAR
jgi:Tol biopolymer transport system component